MPNTFSNSDDTLDSRDIIARIEELQEALAEVTCPECDGAGEVANGQDGQPRVKCAECWGAGTIQPPVDEDNAEELATLTALAEEAEGYAPDWTHGETLIRDSYFTEYAMGLLADCGDLPRELPHYIVIDEEATARNIRMDYTAVEFGDVTYWIR
jgi:hypothetical protein